MGALNWSTEITKHNQVLYAKNKVPYRPTGVSSGVKSVTGTGFFESKALFSLSQFSLNGQSAEMKKQMLADRYVLANIAILGQATAIYASPNMGKTLLVLWMLIKAIKDNLIKAEDVYYINADDDSKGLQYKTELAEKYGFQMICPSYKGFESACLQDYMSQMVIDNTARGTVIVLDTLKKFTDLMDKKKGSAFMARTREYVANGGTVIMLAHCNKNRSLDGKAVFGGTSDVVDDCDCAYVLDEVSRTSTTKQVEFENKKSRGVVANKLAFSYSVEEGKSYQYRLDSVALADSGAIEQAKKDRVVADGRAKDQEAIDAITKTIVSGVHSKVDLIADASKCSGISQNVITKVLNKYIGKSQLDGGLWLEQVGSKNAKSYHLLMPSVEAGDEYLSCESTPLYKN